MTAAGWRRPSTGPRARGRFRGLVDVHGGRWFLNDRSADRHMNAALAASGMVVAAVDFRLAPGHPYPAQIADVNYAVRWMKANAGRLNIAPDSVGPSAAPAAATPSISAASWLKSSISPEYY